MSDFLTTYKAVISNGDVLLSDEQRRRLNHDRNLKTVLSAVVVLLRRHSVDNQLCCGDNENNLRVTGVDDFGFVTQVTCKRCQNPMDATCHDVECTKERIYNKRQLKVGDHICWHRPYAIWHHAIVTRIDPTIEVIHYYSHLTVEEARFEKVRCCRICQGCDALYRINYHDSYSAKYSVLRAQILLNESRYNMMERNCEHFSSWCKTGSTKSSQVSIFWASLMKTAGMGVLRVIALLILFLIQFSHEAFEEQVKDRQWHETVEKIITCVYIVVVGMIFMIRLMITSGKRLTIDRSCMKHENIKHQRSRMMQWHDKCTENSRYSTRLCCCLVCCCCSLTCKAFYSLLTYCCRHIKCVPCTCWRRPGNIACGVFLRIFLREILGLLGTLYVVLNEDNITNARHIAKLPAVIRTTILMGIIIAVQLGGYVAGAILGRITEAFFESSFCSKCFKSSCFRQRFRGSQSVRADYVELV